MGDKPQFTKLIGVYERDKATIANASEPIAISTYNQAYSPGMR